MSKGKGFTLADIAKLQKRGFKVTGLLEPRISSGKVFVSQPAQELPSDGTTLVFMGFSLFPSLNKALRKHWALRKEAGRILDFQVMAQKPRKYACKVKITGVRYTTMLLDDDAISSTFKSLLDSLVRGQYIVDDKPEWLMFSATQQKVSKRKEHRVEIKIEPIILEEPFL